MLTYHVVAGKVTAGELLGKIRSGGGTARLTTVNGGQLTATTRDGKVIIRDAKGGEATVTATDLKTGNGIIHVTDAVSLPG